MALVLLAVYLLMSTGISGYGGSVPGPRYLVPVIPFLAVPLAEMWSRWRLITTAAALLSSFWMILATIVDPLYERGNVAPIDWLRDAASGAFDKSIPGVLLSPPAILVMVAATIACAAGALWLGQCPPDGAHPVDADTFADPVPARHPTMESS